MSMERTKSPLYQLRRSFNLTQDEVAKKLNISKSEYGKIERGDRRLSSDMEPKLADLYGIDIGTVINIHFNASLKKSSE